MHPLLISFSFARDSSCMWPHWPARDDDGRSSPNYCAPVRTVADQRIQRTRCWCIRCRLYIFMQKKIKQDACIWSRVRRTVDLTRRGAVNMLAGMPVCSTFPGNKGRRRKRIGGRGGERVKSAIAGRDAICRSWVLASCSLTWDWYIHHAS